MSGIIENKNSAGEPEAGTKRPRGRPRGSGRKHAPGSRPKTFRNFSLLSEGLIAAIRLAAPEHRDMSDAEIIEEALVRLARHEGNRIPSIQQMLAAHGR